MHPWSQRSQPKSTEKDIVRLSIEDNSVDNEKCPRQEGAEMITRNTAVEINAGNGGQT